MGRIDDDIGVNRAHYDHFNLLPTFRGSGKIDNKCDMNWRILHRLSLRFQLLTRDIPADRWDMDDYYSASWEIESY